MQAKVSMVMPCYNKQDYIAIMLDSIRNQVWDNIELILVNDGSTDNTREVIAEWEPRLRERGYEVVIIDQENAGVISAAKAGLERVTGDYVCQVDADDELDSVYVSTMAGWLEKHLDYHYAVCGYIAYSWCGGKKIFHPFMPIEHEEYSDNTLEKFIVNHIMGTVWQYVVRTDYFYKCGVLENYATTSRWSHEPGYILPIHALGGKFKYFELPLYHFCFGGTGMSQYKSFEYYEKYVSEHKMLCKKAILSLPGSVADSARKQKLLMAVDFSLIKHLYSYLGKFSDGEAQRERIVLDLGNFISSFSSNRFPVGQISGREEDLIKAITNIFVNKKAPPDPSGRVIAYGAAGKNAARLIPILRDTPMEVAVLWDSSANGTTKLFGLSVEKPDPESLLDSDTVLVLPTNKNALVEIGSQLTRAKPCRILYYEDITNYLLHNIYFPELFR